MTVRSSFIIVGIANTAVPAYRTHSLSALRSALQAACRVLAGRLKTMYANIDRFCSRRKDRIT